MFIYKITNKVNEKSYVGQTTISIKNRWEKHVAESKRSNTSMIIAMAIRKYGKENFIVEHIDSASSQEELNQKEFFYISMFNTMVPNGYNVLEGSTNEGRKKRSCSLISPSGELIRIDDLSSFCERMNLDYCKIIRVVFGERYSHLGWRSANRRNKIFRLINTEREEIIELIDIRGERKSFCEKYEINQASLYRVLKGKQNTASKWRLLDVQYTETSDNNLMKERNSMRKHSKEAIEKMVNTSNNGKIKHVLDNRNLKIYEFKNTSEFGRNFKVPSCCLCKVVDKTKKYYKIWTIPEKALKHVILENGLVKEEILYGEVKKWCRKHNIVSSNIFNLIKGRYNNKDGWKATVFTPDISKIEVIKLDY